MSTAATLLLALGCAGGIVFTLQVLWRGRHLAFIEDLEPADPPAFPRVSVVVAARDEAARLEASARSLLAQEPAVAQLVLVDDRSTDATGRIVDGLAEEDARVHAVHVAELPPGWLGKPHALAQGLEAVTGDWILLTDADVHFEPGVLQRAVAWCLDRRLDHLTIGPSVDGRSTALLAAVWTFGAGLVHGLKMGPGGVLQADSFIGIGAFNLVRRKAYERSEGMEWLRQEVADDVGLGLALRRAGARSGFLVSRELLHMEWYASLSAMMHGLEKNTFAFAAHFRYGRALLLATALFLVALGPLLILAVPHWRWLGAAALLLGTSAGAVRARRAHFPVLPTLLAPFGLCVLGTIVLRSAWHCWRQGGIIWRGTHYPVAELRAGQRVKF